MACRRPGTGINGTEDDDIFGVPGDNFIQTDERSVGAPPERDIVFCGFGIDTVDADPSDVLIGCERSYDSDPPPDL